MRRFRRRHGKEREHAIPATILIESWRRRRWCSSDAPAEIATAAGLPCLVEALRAAGFEGDDLEELLYRNWIRVLQDTWGG